MKAKFALVPAAVLAAVLATTGSAQAAGSVSGTVDVKLTIGSGCVVSNADSSGSVNKFGVVDFGSHSTLANIVDAQSAGVAGASTILLNCTNGTNYSVGLNDGANASITQRRMAKGADFVNYELYKEAARTSRWGAIGSGTELTGTGIGTDVALTIYGRVPAQTTPSAGAYTDTVVATIAW